MAIFERGPGYTWNVRYQFEDEEPDTMTVFGEIAIEGAVREARFSLDGIGDMNAGTYRILGCEVAE